MDIPWGDFRSPWGVFKINGETPLVFIKRRIRYLISIHVFRRGWCVSATDWLCPAVKLITSLHFPLWTALSSSISIDYTSKRHTADRLSHAVCSAEIFAENSARKFSLSTVWAVNPSGLLKKWDDWYLRCVAGSVFPFLTVQHMPQTYRCVHSLTHLRLWFGLQ